jgi:hypothetical protein
LVEFCAMALAEDRNTSTARVAAGMAFFRNTEPPSKTWVANESTWRDEGR